MRNNALHLLLTRYDHLSRVVNLHHHLVQELKGLGLVDDRVLTLAALAVERDQLQASIRRAERMTGEGLREVFESGLEDKRGRLRQVEQQITEIRRTLRVK